MVLSMAVDCTDDGSVDGCKVSPCTAVSDTLGCMELTEGTELGAPEIGVDGVVNGAQEHKIKLGARHATQSFEGDHCLARRYC